MESPGESTGASTATPPSAGASAPSSHELVHAPEGTTADTHAPFTHVSSPGHATPRHVSRRSMRIASPVCGMNESSRLATMQPLASVGSRHRSGGCPSGRVITAKATLPFLDAAGKRTTLPMFASAPAAVHSVDEADGAAASRSPSALPPTTSTVACWAQGTSLKTSTVRAVAVAQSVDQTRAAPPRRSTPSGARGKRRTPLG